MKKTIIKARALSMNVEETVKNKHLNLDEGDKWVKKNLNETGRIIEVIHYVDDKEVGRVRDADYVDPEIMTFTMDVKKYKKNE